jgi:hypothetical protein
MPKIDSDDEVIVQRRDDEGDWQTVATFTGHARNAEAMEEARTRIRIYGGTHRIRQITTLGVYEGGKGQVSSIEQAVEEYRWPKSGPSKEVALAVAQHQADKHRREHYAVALRHDPTQFSVVANGWGDHPWHHRVDPKRR